MANAICKLCRNSPPIENSHLWPSFAYKRYVSNLAEGGAFVDLGEMRRHNKQLKRDWFCTSCEGLFAEKYAAELLTELDKKRDGCKVTGELLRFATSLSYRACLYDLHDGDSGSTNDATLRQVCNHWGEYLLGKSQTVRPFTQHACVIADTDTPWGGRLGGEVAYLYDLVMTQVGPLVVFGMIKSKSGASKWEKWCLGKTELTHAGGILETISERAKRNYALTLEMAAQLTHAGNWCIDRADKFDSGTGKKNTGKKK